jgi:ABC-type multidrug transport system ATPase subunit
MSLLELAGVSFEADRENGLRGISLSVDVGEIVAIRGSRGAGKTSLIRIAAGLQRPDAGTVTFEGNKTSKARGRRGGFALAHWRWLPEVGDTLLDHVADPLTNRMSEKRARAAASSALDAVGLDVHRHDSPYSLLAEDQRRAGIARAIAIRPRLLLVDEPTTGLDADARDMIVRLLHTQAKAGIAVLMTVDSAAGLAGTRPLSLHQGQLRGDPARRPAAVVPLRPGQTS